MGFVFTMSKILLIYSVMIEQPFVWIHSIWVWSNNNYIGLATPPSPPTSPTWYCDKGRNRIMRSRYIQDTRQLYLWSIGTIYMIAFVSLYVQIPGKMVMQFVEIHVSFSIHSYEHETIMMYFSIPRFIRSNWIITSLQCYPKTKR